MAQLQGAIAVLGEQVKLSREQYETLKERNQSELARLNLQRAKDFRRMMQRLAGAQSLLGQAAADAWGGLAAQYE